MTRKEKITAAALHLFTTDGIENTPTTRIAKIAGVSEALIFKHFGNKEGLLQSCILSQEKKMKELLDWTTEIAHPKQRIKHLIQLSSQTSKDKYGLTWKVLIAINNQTLLLDGTFIKVVKDLLESTFRELRYKRPNDEADLLLLILTSLNAMEDQERAASIIQFLLIKYNLN